jgi:hypothetical protein
MLHTYAHAINRLTIAEPVAEDAPQPTPVWFDLVNPTPEENGAVEAVLGIAIPTRDEMEDIELSARLYQEDGAEFMTITALTNLDSDEPVKTPITFILKETSLVTVRYSDPKPFSSFAMRAQRSNAVSCATGELAMLPRSLPQQGGECDEENTRPAVGHRTDRPKGRPSDSRPGKSCQHIPAGHLSCRLGKPGTAAIEGDPTAHQAVAAR